jgi:hypothetical protein
VAAVEKWNMLRQAQPVARMKRERNPGCFPSLRFTSSRLRNPLLNSQRAFYGTTRIVSVPLIDTPPFVLPFNTAIVSLVVSWKADVVT